MTKSSEISGKVCHDCGQNGPEWCSINHGVLLCDECCSVHLSLGRHISQIKSFKRSYWSPTQLNLINELSSNGANLIWEYGLRDPQNKISRKKPSAKDSLLIKADFIRNKYQQMAYINRLKDETNEIFEDLNLQLHSIVRTDNIVTCLRFLSQGADPNFKNPETGTSSIHVAASRGQCNQIELLCIYGGDPAALDSSGVSTEEHARIHGYSDLADRLIELQYELTDRLTCFIGGQRPDHKTNQHILLPKLNENLDTSNQIFIARRKLQQLPNSLFEDLAMDVFDEIERRELNTLWHAQVDKAFISLHFVPFLPVNPILSATRNQGRQKLARCELKEFTIFIYDILDEVRRRFYGFIQQSTISESRIFPHYDDSPVYDKVVSDEDNNSLNNDEQQKKFKINRKTKKLSKDQSIDRLLQSPTESLHLSDISSVETIQNHHSYDLKSRIVNTEIQVKYLACAYIDLKNELAVLHQMIQRLLDENLFHKIDQQTAVSVNIYGTKGFINKSTQQLFDNLSRKSSPFIESDYDNTTIIDDRENPLLNLTRSTFYDHDKRSSRTVYRFPQLDEYPSNNCYSSQSMDCNNETIEVPISQSQQTNKIDIPIVVNCSRSSPGGGNTPILLRKGSYNQTEMTDNIDQCTRKITHCIAEFFSLIEENQSDRYSTYAERINNSVRDIRCLSEQMSFNDDIQANLDMLNKSTQQLLTHVTLNKRNPTTQIQFIIDDCYNIARAVKDFLSLYQK